jgi:hypothetical protein
VVNALLDAYGHLTLNTERATPSKTRRCQGNALVAAVKKQVQRRGQAVAASGDGGDDADDVNELLGEAMGDGVVVEEEEEAMADDSDDDGDGGSGGSTKKPQLQWAWVVSLWRVIHAVNQLVGPRNDDGDRDAMPAFVTDPMNFAPIARTGGYVAVPGGYSLVTLMRAADELPLQGSDAGLGPTVDIDSLVCVNGVEVSARSFADRPAWGDLALKICPLVQAGVSYASNGSRKQGLHVCSLLADDLLRKLCRTAARTAPWRLSNELLINGSLTFVVLLERVKSCRVPRRWLKVEGGGFEWADVAKNTYRKYGKEQIRGISSATASCAGVFADAPTRIHGHGCGEDGLEWLYEVDHGLFSYQAVRRGAALQRLPLAERQKYTLNVTSVCDPGVDSLLCSHLGVYVMGTALDFGCGRRQCKDRGVIAGSFNPLDPTTPTRAAVAVMIGAATVESESRVDDDDCRNAAGAADVAVSKAGGDVSVHSHRVAWSTASAPQHRTRSACKPATIVAADTAMGNGTPLRDGCVCVCV